MRKHPKAVVFLHGVPLALNFFLLDFVAAAFNLASNDSLSRVLVAMMLFPFLRHCVPGTASFLVGAFGNPLNSCWVRNVPDVGGSWDWFEVPGRCWD